MRLKKGLPNLGNTCYINSILQCLRYTKAFVYPLKHVSMHGKTKLLQSLVDLLFADAPDSALFLFVNELATINKEFSLFRQADAHELLLYLLDLFYSSMKIKNVFRGTFHSNVICSQCNNTSTTESAFLSVSVPLAASVQSAMEAFCEVEVLDENILCDNCKEKTKSSRQLNIVASDILVVHLKRFHMGDKLDSSIAIDKDICVNGTQYKLYSIVNHVGGVQKWTLHGCMCKAEWHLDYLQR